MSAYYNEHDPYAAQWLRNLMSAGHIAPGFVDERSIEDVHPDDLREFKQCHFFAGIGVWSLALRRAGWPDDRPVWTGSCPCQPFSSAGEGAGFNDERHLWPDFHWLIQERKPTAVFGEQVASKIAEPWVDLVQADLEAMGYAFGCVPFPSAGVGAPHMRDRLYWVADSNRQRLHGVDSPVRTESIRHAEAGRRGETVHDVAGSQRRICGLDGKPSRLADTNCQQRPNGKFSIGAFNDSGGRHESTAAIAGLRDDMHTGPTNGLWRDADWLFCRDGKWRPVEPGTFPLADGAPSRVGRLRAYGNSINAYQAQIFIESAMSTMQ